MEGQGPNINVIISADISNLKNKLQAAEISMESLTKAEQNAAAQAIILARNNKILAESYKEAQKGSGAAQVTFLEFNRIIQDAPFGMIGVGNNIQQLTANFELLTGKAGGTTEGLKAFFATAMSGLNPLIFAVSAITTIWTLYERGVFDSKETTKDFNEELKNFLETLSAVDRARLTGLSNGAKEVRTFEELRAQAENANIPLKDRIEAVNDLQSKFPDYLGNLTQEQILTGNVGKAYDDLTKNIIANAKARAFSSKIAENSIKILEIEERTNKRAQDLLEAQTKLEKAKVSDSAPGSKLAGQLTAVDQGRVQAQDAVNKLTQEQLADVEAIQKINADNLILQRSISEQISEGARFTEDQAKGVEKVKNEANDAFKAFSKAQDEFNRIFFMEGKSAANAFNAELKEIEATQKRMEALSKSIVESFAKPELTDNILKGMKPSEEKADIYNPSAELDEMARKARLTQSAFDGLGRAVSRAFGQGNEWGRFASDFLRFAGEVIAANFAMSKANMITGATASGAASGPLAAFVTPGLITAGLALIGSLFGAISSGKSSGGGGGASSKSYGKLPGRRFGGFVSAGLDYVVGENRPEIFRPSFSGRIYPSYEDYTSNTKGSAGSVGNIKVDVEVHGIIEGENIRVTNKRAERRVNKS